MRLPQENQLIPGLNFSVIPFFCLAILCRSCQLPAVRNVKNSAYFVRLLPPYLAPNFSTAPMRIVDVHDTVYLTSLFYLNISIIRLGLARFAL